MKRDNSFSNRSDMSSDLSTVSSFTIYSKRDSLKKDIKKVVTEKLYHKLNDVLEGLKIFDEERTGKVLPTKLHKVLNLFCHPLTLTEFNELLTKDRLDENGYVSYISFLSFLTQGNKDLDGALLDKENKINMLDTNTEEMELNIKRKISKNLKNFIRSMWLYDYNHDGLIQKQEFRRVLENHCFPLNDDQFNRLWSIYDPTQKGVLNYKDFLLKLGSRSESYKRILPKDLRQKIKDSSFNDVSKARYKQLEKRYAKLGRDDPAVQGQVIDSVIDVFKKRVEKNFPILLRTFQIKYGCENGIIPVSVFHQVLNYFVMPMSSQLFKQVLISFNVSPTVNKIQWYEFLKSVCNNEVRKYQSDISHFSRSHNWSVCKSIMDKLKKNGKSSENFFQCSFTMVDQNNKMTVTRAELRRTINSFLSLPLSEEEFRSLAFILDPGHTNIIDCSKFLSLLNSFASENGDKRSEELNNKMLHCEETTLSQLSGEKLKSDFKKSFNKNFKNIEKAVNAFDSEETGFMQVKDLCKILETFCFPLTDAQSQEIFNGFSIFSNKIFYHDFFNHYKKGPYEDEEKWAQNVKKLTTVHHISRKIEKEELLRCVREAVKAHKDKFFDEFKSDDYCDVGIAKKETLGKLLNKYVFRMSEEQFDMLWNVLPINEMGFLKYQEFLKDFSRTTKMTSNNEKINSPSSVNSQFLPQSLKKSYHLSPSIIDKGRPKTASSIMTAKSSHASKSSCRPKSATSNFSWEKTQSLLENESAAGESLLNFVVQGQGCSVLTNEQYKQYRSLNFGNAKSQSRPNISKSIKEPSMVNENIRNHEMKTSKMKYSEFVKSTFVNSVKSRWRDILRRCKAQDPENHNIIPWDIFQSILQKTGVDTNDEIQNLLDSEYNIKKELPVNYWIFLKKFLLTLDSWNLKKTNAPNTKVTSQKDWTGLYKVLLSNRDKILKNYRDLRHAFRRVDLQHCGNIKASEFRKILTLHKIFLSEDDFFYICDYFDPKLTERISYDEFLETFLQN